jgi:hypothetical protein
MLKLYPFALCFFLLLLVGCRGEIRNPAALTPWVTVTAIAPPTSTLIPTPTLPPTLTPLIVVHIVAAGDTLYGISLQYNTSVEAIQQQNGLDEGAILNVGQELRIPQ